MNLVLYYGVLACPGCGGRLRLVAVLDEAPATARILAHLHLPTDAVARPGARVSCDRRLGRLNLPT